MFKVNCKDIGKTSLTLSDVPVVNFKHILNLYLACMVDIHTLKTFAVCTGKHNINYTNA